MSRDRSVYVWRLRVAYPDGAFEPGFRPAAQGPALPSWRAAFGMRRARFRWPKERMFLSASGAAGRAALLRSYGAAVTVERSDPVSWPAAVPRWPSCEVRDQCMSDRPVDDHQAAAAPACEHYGGRCPADCGCWCHYCLNVAAAGRPTLSSWQQVSTAAAAGRQWLDSLPPDTPVIAAAAPGQLFSQWHHLTVGVWAARRGAPTPDLHAEPVTAAELRALVTAKDSSFTGHHRYHRLPPAGQHEPLQPDIQDLRKNE